MECIAQIKVPNEQGITIARVYQDVSKNLLVLDDFSSKHIWFKNLTELKQEWRVADFLALRCVAKGCNSITLVYYNNKIEEIE